MEQVRLFVSSTFRDMHAERDRLNRFVFPELRSRCARRGIEFIGVDLRWGVTAEAARMRGTTRICLDEIDRCRPFFLGLLGQRRGWVPPLEELDAESLQNLRNASARDTAALELVNHWYVRDETARAPMWRLRSDVALPVDVAENLIRLSVQAGIAGAGVSLTAREIEHGAFAGTTTESRSFLYIRQPGYLDDPRFPTDFRDVFVERSKTDEEALARLVESVRARSATSVVRDYSVGYEGLRIDPSLITIALSPIEREHLRDGVIQPDEWPALSDALHDALRAHGTVALSGLDTWGDQVVDDVWRAIEDEIGERTRRAKGRAPTDAHEAFIVERTRLFFGREDSVARMTEYLDSPRAHEPLVITGTPGSGKSALMAELVRRHRVKARRNRATVIFPFFIGAAPDSTALISALRSILTKIRDACRLDIEIPNTAADVRAALPRFLQRAGEHHRVMLVLDALDQLDPAAGSHELDWLPARLPRGVRVIVSTLAGDILDRLRERTRPEMIVELPALELDDRKRLIEELLKQRGKQLTPEQLAPLLDVDARADVALPLYLRVALEELTLFGEYAALSARIAALPATVRELFDQVLARLESDHGADLVERVLGALAASRDGLTESEVLALLADALPTCTRLDFTRFYRALTAYLRPNDEESGRGLIGFYHEQLRRAVNRRYFNVSGGDTASPELATRHAELAGYFSRHRDTPRGLSEIVWQQLRANDWDGAERTLCDLRFLDDKVRVGMTSAIEADYDDALTSIPADRIDGDRGVALRAFADFVTSESHNFNRWDSQPGFCIQQAYNSASAGPVGAASDDAVRDVRGKVPMQLCHPKYRAQYDPEPVIVRTLVPGKNGPEGQDTSGVAVTGDGAIAISTFDCDLVAWDLRTGRRIRTLNDDAGFAQCIAVSRDGRTAVSGHGDATLCVWDVRTGICLRRLRGHTDRPATVAITPDARLAASGGSFDDHTVRLWDVASGNCLATFEHDAEVSFVAISPDGTVIASVDDNGTLRIVEVATRKVRRSKGPDFVKRPLAITPDSKFLIVGNENAMFHVRELPSGRRVRRSDTRNEESGAVFRRSPTVAVTHDGRFVVTATNFAMCLWNIETLECVRHVGPASGSVAPLTQLALSDDPSRPITVSYDGVVNVWDLAAGRHDPTEAEVGSTAHVEAVTFQPDGRRALAAHSDGTLQWHDTRKGWGLETKPRGLRYVQAIALSADGARIIVGAAARLLLYEIRNDAPFRPTELKGNKDVVQALTSSLDGRTVVSGDDGNRIRVWDLVTRKMKRVLAGHSDAITSLAIASDGCLLLSGSLSSGLKRDAVALWHLRTGKRLRLLRVAGEEGDGSAVALSPDGQLAVNGGVNAQIDVWDVRTGKRLHKLLGHTDWIQGLAFTADGTRLVSAGRDQTTRVWNVASGECEHVCVHPFNPLSLAVRGRRIIVGGQVGNTRLLELSGVPEGPAIVTASRPYEFAHGTPAPHFFAHCPWCSRTQRTPETILQTIRTFAVRGTGAPAVAVSPDGFSDARLRAECSYCKGGLRYNPFVVGGELV